MRKPEKQRNRQSKSASTSYPKKTHKSTSKAHAKRALNAARSARAGVVLV